MNLAKVTSHFLLTTPPDARELFFHLEHPVLGKTLTDSSPMRFKNQLARDWKAAPLLGEDNCYVYMGLLGLTEREFSSYVQKGVIGHSSSMAGEAMEKRWKEIGKTFLR